MCIRCRRAFVKQKQKWFDANTGRSATVMGNLLTLLKIIWSSQKYNVLHPFIKLIILYIELYLEFCCARKKQTRTMIKDPSSHFLATFWIPFRSCSQVYFSNNGQKRKSSINQLISLWWWKTILRNSCKMDSSMATVYPEAPEKPVARVHVIYVT